MRNLSGKSYQHHARRQDAKEMSFSGMAGVTSALEAIPGSKNEVDEWKCGIGALLYTAQICSRY
jgi:hypothetical protein